MAFNYSFELSPFKTASILDASIWPAFANILSPSDIKIFEIHRITLRLFNILLLKI